MSGPALRAGVSRMSVPIIHAVSDPTPRLDWRQWLADPGGFASLLLLGAALSGAGAGVAAVGVPGLPWPALLVVAAPMVAAALAWRCASRAGPPGGWRYLAAGMVVWATFRLASLILGTFGVPTSGPVLVLGIVAWLLLLGGAGRFLRGSLRPGIRQLMWLDTTILALGLGALLWALDPGHLRPALGQLPADPAVWAPLAGAVLVLLVALPLLVPDPKGQAPQRWLLAASVAVLGAALAADRPAGPQAALAVSDALLLLACAFVGLGAHCAYLSETPPLESSAPRPTRRPVELLPVAGLTLALASTLHGPSGALPGPGGAMILVVAVVALLTLVRQSLAATEKALHGEAGARREAEERFAALVRNSSDVILICASEGRVGYATASAERVFGVPPDGLAGQLVTDLLGADDRGRLKSLLAQEIALPGASASVELKVPRGGDRFRVIEVVATNLMAEPAVGGCVLNIRDVTDRRMLEDQLRRLAFHDPLTLLANRALFRDRVQHALDVKKRRRQRVAAIFVDLDNFKKINDSLGHGEGDRVLRTTAQRLTKCTRTADTVARLGGDEFAVLVEDARDEAQVLDIARRIVETLKEPFAFLDSSLRVAASVGVAFAEDGEGVEELLRNADVAMYQAKAQGKSRFAVFQREMQQQIQNRLRVEAELTRAIGRGELRLHYQPIVELRSGYLLGVEALVRWQHPERGLIGPSEFIAVAEESGQVMGLGRWVLHEACKEVRAWQDRMPRGRELRVSVNVSSQQLQSGDLVGEVKAALAGSGLDAGSLVLEMTESVVMQDTEATFAKLNLLKRLGVRIAIDDFGTGYSSLSYLHRFPLDILKIDRSFVTRLGEERDGTELARAIVTLGDTLGLEVVAEGIEFEHQLQGLIDIGCVAGQGYYWSRPALLEEIEFSHQARLRRQVLESLPGEAETSATGRFRVPRFASLVDLSALPATGSDGR
jgi:diguanylate cyclase (GGDEF)-like protein/PAS domain S-box-containing protein